MQIQKIIDKALNFEEISPDEAYFLYEYCPDEKLRLAAQELRMKMHKEKIVTYIIDRNINYTNVCYSKCMFCNFCRNVTDSDSYVVSNKCLKEKIQELYKLGGKQVLLQGGMNSSLGTEYFINLFRELKNEFPDLWLHALSPSEIVFLAKKEKKTIEDVLLTLNSAGLDSLPGAGAEILSDRVRKIISPAKCTVDDWINVMTTAHKHEIITSATMMFGHIETLKERIDHLLLLRNIQNQKPHNAVGFISFTLWPLAGDNTKIKLKFPKIKAVGEREYLRILAISRLVLNNISNIQVSWLSMGESIASKALSYGANDMSSIMIEENVMSSAGKNFRMNQYDMEKLILESGFVPAKRNQKYEIEII